MKSQRIIHIESGYLWKKEGKDMTVDEVKEFASKLQKLFKKEKLYGGVKIFRVDANMDMVKEDYGSR